MAYMYGILAVVGWAWTVVVALYLIPRLRHREQTVQQNEKQF